MLRCNIANLVNGTRFRIAGAEEDSSTRRRQGRLAPIKLFSEGCGGGRGGRQEGVDLVVPPKLGNNTQTFRPGGTRDDFCFGRPGGPCEEPALCVSNIAGGIVGLWGMRGGEHNRGAHRRHQPGRWRSLAHVRGRIEKGAEMTWVWLGVTKNVFMEKGKNIKMRHQEVASIRGCR